MLIPNPGYPTYRSAATISGGVCVDYLLREQNGWMPDFAEIECGGLDGVKIMIVNFPHMPTGAAPREGLFRDLVAFARKHNILLLHDCLLYTSGLDLARHFAKRRAGMDRDIRSEAAVRHNVVERSFVPLYSDFKLSFHLVFPFVIGRSSARAVPHKKSRPWVRTGIDIVSSNDSFAINNAIPVRFRCV